MTVEFWLFVVFFDFYTIIRNYIIALTETYLDSIISYNYYSFIVKNHLNCIVIISSIPFRFDFLAIFLLIVVNNHAFYIIHSIKSNCIITLFCYFFYIFFIEIGYVSCSRKVCFKYFAGHNSGTTCSRNFCISIVCNKFHCFQVTCA